MIAYLKKSLFVQVNLQSQSDLQLLVLDFDMLHFTLHAIVSFDLDIPDTKRGGILLSVIVKICRASLMFLCFLLKMALA